MADSYGGEMHIISWWDYEFEIYLRRNAWIKIPDAQTAEATGGTQLEHRRAIERLINVSGISGSHQVHHLRGQAGECIASFVDNQKIDILVMRMLGRTAIPGFIIGNRAENVGQKPHLFVARTQTAGGLYRQ